MGWSKLPQPDGEGADPQPLRAALEGVLRGLGAPPVDALTTLHERWDDIVGPAAATECRPRSIEHATLVVETPQPAWASQLRWQAADLVERAAEVLGAGIVERVEVRVTRPS